MNAHINLESIIESIKLQLQHHSTKEKVFILLEGESDDKIFRKFFDKACVQTQVTEGVYNLAGAAAAFCDTHRVIGIRDADFLRMGESGDPPPNIFLTDFHDAEMMTVMCDETFRQVAEEHLHQEKNPLALRGKCLESLIFISCIRWINDSEHLEINFNGIAFGNFFNAGEVCINEEACITDIHGRSPNRKRNLTVPEIRQKAKSLTLPNDSPHLCNGHDFNSVFALYINSKNKQGVSQITLAKEFRIACRIGDFQPTDLFRDLSRWAESHGKRLFRTA
jgi:hypothetical protein